MVVEVAFFFRGEKSGRRFDKSVMVVVEVTFFLQCEECGRSFDKSVVVVVVMVVVVVKVTFSPHVKNVGESSAN